MRLRSRIAGRKGGRGVSRRRSRPRGGGGRGETWGRGCPVRRRATGARDASPGDRPCPAPGWPRAALPPRPRPRPGPGSWRGGRRRWPEGRPTRPARRRRRRHGPPWAAGNRQAAGLASGAAAHAVAVLPRDAASPGRGVGAGPADLDAGTHGLAPCGLTTGARASTGGDGWPLGA
jgi:hypothetical protein